MMFPDNVMLHMMTLLTTFLTSWYWTYWPRLTHSLFSVSTATSPGLPASTLRNLVSGE